MKCQNWFSGKNKNNISVLTAENFTQSAKGYKSGLCVFQFEAFIVEWDYIS